jgi:hypothetical protein
MTAASNAKLSKSIKSRKSKSGRTKGKRKTKSRNSPVPKLEYMDLPDFEKIDQATLEQSLRFWSPVFKIEELVSLKEKINEMLAEDAKIKLVNKEVPELWSVCKIIKKYFPAYFVPMKNKSYIGPRGYARHEDIDFSNYQILCCTSMIVYGIISARLLLHDQDYQLIFKGGKAIQMGLLAEYDSEDIDIVVDPIYAYDPVMINNIAGHLALLMKWLLPFSTSILPPTHNPTLYKLSFMTSHHSYKPFSDIDFKEIDKTDLFFKELYTDQYYVAPLDEHVVFKRPTIEKIVEEKIFYYSKYKALLQRIQQGEVIEGLTKRYCILLMDKFKRAIQAIAPDTDFERL